MNPFQAMVVCVVLASRDAALAQEKTSLELKDLLAKANSGDVEAQNRLGFVYGTGQGVSANFKEAANWFRKAAEQGRPGSSLCWLDLAAGHGDEDATKARDSLACQMSPEQIAAAQKLSQDLFYQIARRNQKAKEQQ